MLLSILFALAPRRRGNPLSVLNGTEGVRTASLLPVPLSLPDPLVPHVPPKTVALPPHSTRVSEPLLPRPTPYPFDDILGTLSYCCSMMHVRTAYIEEMCARAPCPSRLSKCTTAPTTTAPNLPPPPPPSLPPTQTSPRPPTLSTIQPPICQHQPPTSL